MLHIAPLDEAPDGPTEGDCDEDAVGWEYVDCCKSTCVFCCLDCDAPFEPEDVLVDVTELFDDEPSATS